jgi:hypothetical protein
MKAKTRLFGAMLAPLAVAAFLAATTTASRVDTAFTSGFLADFLGFSGTSPANPIGAFLPATQTLQPSATGFFVFQADLGLRQLGNPSNSPAGPNLDVEQTLALGSTIVAFLNTNVTGGTQSGFVATAPSGQLFVVPGPAEGAGLPGLIAACGGLLALARRRRMQAA